jgi:hypothetical protein
MEEITIHRLKGLADAEREAMRRTRHRTRKRSLGEAGAKHLPR